MGNFSRDTFDPSKNYVGVRLQQGVPLVDADWNELNDVIRQELHESFSGIFPDGIVPDAFPFLGALLEALAVLPGGENNISVVPGRAFIGGRSITLNDFIDYNEQPWRNSERAIRDDIKVLPDLTTPEEDSRIDIVHLEVWEREVSGDIDGDPSIIDPVIGIPTCVRLKREVAIRVTEDIGDISPPRVPPDPSPNHVYLPLALLRRQRGQVRITGEDIEDIRPLIFGNRGWRYQTFMPAFLTVFPASPFGIADPETPITYDSWQLSFKSITNQLPGGVPITSFYLGKFSANNFRKPAQGLLPLTLPDRALMIALRIWGFVEGDTNRVNLNLYRISNEYNRPSGSQVDAIISPSIVGSEVNGFDRILSIPTRNRQHIVDNRNYYYGLYAETRSSNPVEIHGIQIIYTYEHIFRSSS